MSESGGVAEVVPQYSAQSLASTDWAADAAHLLSRFDEAIGEALMVAFPMVMPGELAESVAERHFADEDHAVQALGLQASAEPFDVRVGPYRQMLAIGALSRDGFV